MTDTLRDQVTAAYEKEAEEVVKPEEEIVEQVEAPEDDADQDDLDDLVEEEEEEFEAPAHWDQNYRDEFKTIDSKSKKFLLSREKDLQKHYTKKQQALAEDQRYAESTRKTIAPYENYLKQNNIDHNQAFEKLLSTEIRLRTASPHEKALILQDLGRHYGAQVDFNAEIPQIDPQVKYLHDKVAQQEAYLTRIEQERLASEERGYINQIDEFKSEKDDRGNFRNPHFEDLREEMGKLLSSGFASSLKEAYYKATLLNEDLKKEVISREARNEESRKRAAASKTASFNVKSASTSKISDVKEQLSRRDLIARVLDASNRG